MSADVYLVSLDDIARKFAFRTDKIISITSIGGSPSYSRVMPHLLVAPSVMAKTLSDYGQLIGDLEPIGSPLRAVCIPDAIVTGRGAVITSAGQLIRETVRQPLAERRLPEGFEPSIDGNFTFHQEAVNRIDPPAVRLKWESSDSYIDWLLNVAAILVILPELGVPPHAQLLLNAPPNPKMQSLMSETLCQLAPDRQIIMQPDDEVWVYTNICVISPIIGPGLFSNPFAISKLRLALRSLATSNGQEMPPRIFVGSNGARGPHLSNEQEIFDLVSGFGFIYLSPDEIGLLYLVRKFSGAEIIIVVSGELMANVVFAQPQATILVLSPDDPVDLRYWDLATHANVVYWEMIGSTAPFHDIESSKSRFVIDIDDFKTGLAAILRDARKHNERPANARQSKMTSASQLGRMAAEYSQLQPTAQRLGMPQPTKQLSARSSLWRLFEVSEGASEFPPIPPHDSPDRGGLLGQAEEFLAEVKAIKPTGPDAGLIEACLQLWKHGNLHGRIRTIDKDDDAYTPMGVGFEDMVYNQLMSRVIITPATTTLGIRTKAAVAFKIQHTDSMSELKLTRSIILDLLSYLR